MVDGFDLGNSPQEFSAKTVADKRLVMSTTNGTRAFRMAEDADRVLTCCLLNLEAVVDAVASLGWSHQRFDLVQKRRLRIRHSCRAMAKSSSERHSRGSAAPAGIIGLRGPSRQS